MTAQHKPAEHGDELLAAEAKGKACSDCPPIGENDDCRCDDCPRREVHPTPPTSDAIADAAVGRAYRQLLREVPGLLYPSMQEEIARRAREIAAQPGPNIVAWTEKDGDEWIVYDAESDTGKHIRDYQKKSHFKDVFPIYDAPATSPPQVADALDGERLDWLESHDDPAIEGPFNFVFAGERWIVRHRNRTVTSHPTIREAIDTAIAVRAQTGGE